jgi:hypothetical protein
VSALAFVVLAGFAQAHEFTAAILVVGKDRETGLADAVRGFLLAADECDGHPGETSDGHLGGVDVQILPLPPEIATRIEGLTGSPKDPPGVIVVLGSPTEVARALATGSRQSIGLGAGTLPPGWAEASQPSGFAARYRQSYGRAPTRAAAQGYNAARRLDLAIRPLDGLAPRATLKAALAASESGVGW